MNTMKIKKLLSARSLPADEGTVAAIVKLVDELVEAQVAKPVPETRLAVYLSHNYFDEFPAEERAEPGPVPTAMKLLDELRELRSKAAG